MEKHLPDITAKVNKQYRDHATRELANIVRAEIDRIAIGQPVTLGLVDDADDWVIIVLLTKLQVDTRGSEVSSNIVFTLTTALVRGKMLTLIIMRIYEDPDDLRISLDSSKQWTREIAKLNE